MLDIKYAKIDWSVQESHDFCPSNFFYQLSKEINESDTEWSDEWATLYMPLCEDEQPVRAPND